MIITQSELTIAGIAFVCIGAIYKNNLSRLDKTDLRLDRIEKDIKHILEKIGGSDGKEWF